MAVNILKMTTEGKKALEEELEKLETVVRDDIAEKLKVARSYGDLSENSEYDEAKNEQAKFEARINEIKYQLEHAVIIDNSEAFDKNLASMGSKVTVLRLADNKKIVYEIVGFSQANPIEHKISEDSPIGRALIGKKKGDKIIVEAPAGELEFEIKKIER
ncbi:MAG: transcription elongation factor GreA [Eubacterium sp.]|nr:transcription elongation factor GreA [Eubacterium sp.]